MLLLFFLVWMIFNGNVTLELIAFGLVISVLMFAFVCKFMDYSLKKELRLYQSLPDYFKFCCLLVKEIALANLSVARLILSRRQQVEPVLVHVHTKLKTPTARAFYANAITLTPGTITVSVTGELLLVHCLDRSLSQGMEDTELLRLLRKLEQEDGKWN